jgi:hypothetical protein
MVFFYCYVTVQGLVTIIRAVAILPQMPLHHSSRKDNHSNRLHTDANPSLVSFEWNSRLSRIESDAIVISSTFIILGSSVFREFLFQSKRWILTQTVDANSRLKTFIFSKNLSSARSVMHSRPGTANRPPAPREAVIPPDASISARRLTQ